MVQSINPIFQYSNIPSSLFLLLPNPAYCILLYLNGFSIITSFTLPRITLYTISCVASFSEKFD